MISQKLEKCSNEEKLDVLLVLAHFLTEDVKTVLEENGIEIINIPHQHSLVACQHVPNFATKMNF